MATPLEISIAIWYYGRAEDMPECKGHLAPAYVEALRDFVDRGLLETDPSGRCRWKAGPALETYVKALGSVPFPVQQWVIPND